jgi:hypothetical protein
MAELGTAMTGRGSGRDRVPAQDAVLQTLYKEFLYLDGADTLNALASLQGGEVVELVRKVGQETEGGLNFGLRVHFVEAGLTGKKAKHVEQEVRLRQNEHSAIGHLLSALADLTSQQDGKLDEGDVVELAGEAVLIPATSVIAAEAKREETAKFDHEARSRWEKLRDFIRPPAPDSERERQQRYASKGVGERFVVVLAPDKSLNPNRKPVVVPCDRQWLHCDPEDVLQRLARRVRLVGKVEAKADALLVESAEAMSWRVRRNGVASSWPPEIRLDDEGGLKVRPFFASVEGRVATDPTLRAIERLTSPQLASPIDSRSERVQPPAAPGAGQPEWEKLTNAIAVGAPSAGSAADDGAEAYFLQDAIVVRPLCIYR